jgi:hypothetical protein
MQCRLSTSWAALAQHNQGAKMTDEQIKVLAEKQGWFGVESWWLMAIPRFRAMLEQSADPKKYYVVYKDGSWQETDSDLQVSEYASNLDYLVTIKEE